MSTFHEIKDCRQVKGEPFRRWFSADQLDLIVWYDDKGAPSGFQLCYDNKRVEHALTWKPEIGFQHSAIDDGESNPGLQHKRTPILVPDGAVDYERLDRLFAQAGGSLPEDVTTLVTEKLHAKMNAPKAAGELPARN